MITILSPSKSQDFSDNLSTDTYTAPVFLKDSEVLIGALKKKSKNDIKALMEVSDNIAELNVERYKSFKTPFTINNSRQALLAFRGDVYTDIAVDQYGKNAINFAQNHLRIISGLYGLLKPMDLIQPYRLEMKIKLENKRGKNLYQFWGDKLTKLLNDDFDNHKEQVLVNLASQEYFKAIDQDLLKARVITPVFKEYKNGEYKVIAIYAKRARGKMANFIITEGIDEAEQLKTFAEDGYEFSEKHSAEDTWTFIR